MERNGLEGRLIDKRVEQNAIKFSLEEIKDHYENNMNFIEQKFSLYKRLMHDHQNEEADEVLRFQIVLLSSLLDFFNHEIIKYCYYEMEVGEYQKSTSFNKEEVTFGFMNKYLQSENREQLFLNKLDKKFSRETFMSSQSICDFIKKVGLNINDISKVIYSDEKNPAQATKKFKKKMEELFKRRNQIAHQTDRLSTNAQRECITIEYVLDFKQFISLYCGCILNILHEKIL